MAAMSGRFAYAFCAAEINERACGERCVPEVKYKVEDVFKGVSGFWYGLREVMVR